ncbi:uncharacterized protein LOC122089305 [Macadamia integrifolia]|uniref:uncharacterized protein LOC122089305 n=1 Tax=Macadamia integrifolia TaxID=60698 RepID=UPI001C4F8157|nr:uncharacterized protein LOC122089305 [Macadamia integrifolia]
MQVVSNTRRLSRVVRAPLLIRQDRFSISDDVAIQDSKQRSFADHISKISGSICGVSLPVSSNVEFLGHHPMCSMMGRACFTSEACATEGEASATEGGGPSEAVKEIYEKMLKSVEAETMPPNAWMWSLIENCVNREDIALLFQMLQNLRRFRLSNLRIHANFNCNLCLRVTEACARVGAIDFGKKALWKHNVYGLTPSVGSAHYLLFYAKEQKDTKLMVEIMRLLKKNSLSLQPGTADIVFRICYETDNWELISKYSKKFMKAGVKLRRTTFDTWMDFAAKIGDTESLWKIEKLRSDSMKQHTLKSGFSCAKGLLLERKPESAAAVIQALSQNLPDKMKPGIAVELENLVSKWPSEVVEHQKKEDRKAFASSLVNDIRAMITGLLHMGLEVTVNLEDLTNKAIPS